MQAVRTLQSMVSGIKIMECTGVNNLFHGVLTKHVKHIKVTQKRDGFKLGVGGSMDCMVH